MKTLGISHLDPEMKGTGTAKREGSFRLSKALVVILITGLSFLVGSCFVEEPDYDHDADWYEHHHHHHEYYEDHDHDPHFDMDIEVEHHKPPDM